MRPRRLLIVLVLVASGVAAATPSEAAAGVGFTYRSRSVSVAPKDTRALKVGCPRGTALAGGGSSVGGLFAGARLLGSHPFDGDDRDKVPDDGWRGVARNRSSAKVKLSTWAVCAYFATFTYRPAVTVVAAASRPTLTSSCSSSETVVSGGALLKSGRLTFEGSHPADDTSDADATPDNGWIVRVSNTSSKSAKLKVWAVCGSGLTASYVANPRLVNAGTHSQITTLCTGESKATGGGFISQMDVPFVLGETRPYLATADDVSYNGWTVGAWNRDTSPQNVNATAICVFP